MITRCARCNETLAGWREGMIVCEPCWKRGGKELERLIDGGPVFALTAEESAALDLREGSRVTGRQVKLIAASVLAASVALWVAIGSKPKAQVEKLVFQPDSVAGTCRATGSSTSSICTSDSGSGSAWTPVKITTSPEASIYSNRSTWAWWGGMGLRGVRVSGKRSTAGGWIGSERGAREEYVWPTYLLVLDRNGVQEELFVTKGEYDRYRIGDRYAE